MRQLTTRDQSDTKINNYRSPYGLQQWVKAIPHSWLPKAPNEDFKTIQLRKLTA